MNIKPLTASVAGVVAAAWLAGCGGTTADPAAPQRTSNLADIQAVTGSFGIAEDAEFYTIDTGAGLVFKIRRTDNGRSTQSAGDIASMVYKGVQYQDQSRGTQVNSGFDYLYKGISAVDVSAETIGTDFIKVTVQAGNLTHYYLAKKGEPRIYMGTYFTSEPDTLNLARFIVRVPIDALPNGPAPSDLRGTTGAIESGDIFGLPNGETRSKHYSNMRLKDWQFIGATSATAGMWIVRDNNEGNSGGPFYRSLLNQATATNQELTYIINYGEAQTEAFRFRVLNSYTLVFNDGTAPGPVDTGWFKDMNLLGYLPDSARGRVASSVTGREAGVPYTVGLANAQAQYWADVDPADGHFVTGAMRPGDYTLKVYRNELEVETRQVTVQAGATLDLAPVAISADPSATPALWRIGSWDGSPVELLNGDKVTTMHPQDVRMKSWVVPEYEVNSSLPATGFPAYQWKDVNNNTVIKFNLRKSQIGNYRLRIGTTVAFAGARPKVQVNGWVSANPPAPSQPKTRTLTVGTYRGNNTLYTFDIPASELVVGQNLVTISAISGTAGTGFLSPGFAYDAVDLIKQP
ncbi:MAG: rhamnogalacturonan lyase B N-terminal domain-containing protein [Gammaproteobacteria bacterium]